MRLSLRFSDLSSIKKICLATSILGAAAISHPNKAQARNSDFNQFQRKSFSSNNLGRNLVATEVLPKELQTQPFKVAQAEDVVQNDGFVFDGDKPEDVTKTDLSPPETEEPLLDEDIFETDFESLDIEGAVEDESLLGLGVLPEIDLKEHPYEELKEDAEQLKENSEDFNDNYLLLKVTSGKFLLSQGTSAYEVNDQILISMYEIVEALEFPIEVFDEEQTAEGWFIEPKNDFYLDINNNELIIAGRSVKLEERHYKIIDEEIYISSDALKEWFGIDFTLNFSRLTLDIESTEKLVFELKAEREDRWKKAAKSKKRFRKEYPKAELPYKIAEIPSTTILLNGNFSDTEAGTTTSGSYSLQGSGDLLGASAEYFFSGNDTDKVTESRVKLFRYDEDGVFEGTDIKQFEIGDITPARLNLAGSGGVERGVKITNKPLGTITTPDNIIIEGEVEPGWEVELYRNNEFIAFLSDTSDGRFEFDGLSLQGGLNLFRIIKYGPFGEVEEELQRYFIGAGILKEGELNYEASLSQAGANFLPNTVDDYSLSGEHRLVADVEYGVTESFSVGGGFFSGPLFDEQRSGILLNSRASILGTYNRLDHLTNDDGTSISSLSNRINLGAFNISGFATYNNGFDQEEVDTVLDSSIDVNTNINLFGLTSLSLRFGGEYETFQSDQVRYAYSNQLSTTIQGFALSNRLSFETTEIGDSKSETTLGEFFFRKRFHDFLFGTGNDVLFRTNLNYRINPEAEIDSLNLRLEQNVLNNLRLRLNVARTFGDAEITTYEVGTNYTHEYFASSFTMRYDTEGDAAATLNLRFNVGPDYENGGLDFIKTERAQRGSVAAFAYLDKNANNQFDGDDEPIQDVNFRSRFGNKGTSNSSGVALLAGFSGYRTDDIFIDSTSLPDIFYVPIHEGFSVVPRPGNVSNLEFPIVIGGEIDGVIEFEDNQLNNSYDFSQFKLQLVDKEGKSIKEISADQTGYYLFDRVIPGNYTVKIASLSDADEEYIGEMEKQVSFTSDDPVVTDLNFLGKLKAEEIEEINDLEDLS